MASLQWTEMINRAVTLREDTEDRQVWSDTFTGRYHIPPANIKPSTVLDLGCNIGLTLAHYGFMWPKAKIVGVEMDHDCAVLAELNAPSAIVLERAVGGTAGVGTYNPDARSDSFSLGTLGREVQTYTLAETITETFGDTVVDFVKMDIEGAEWEIFACDDWAPRVLNLLVELHPIGEMPNDSEWLLREAIANLKSLGFSANHHRRHPRAVFAWR